MCGQIAQCGQIAEMMGDPRLTWILIQEASLQQRHEELADIAVHLYGQLGEARAEISRLQVSLRGSYNDRAAQGADSPGVIGILPRPRKASLGVMDGVSRSRDTSLGVVDGVAGEPHLAVAATGGLRTSSLEI